MPTCTPSCGLGVFYVLGYSANRINRKRLVRSLLAEIWSQPQILILIPIPLCFIIVKFMWTNFYLPENVKQLLEFAKNKLKSREEALVSPLIRTCLQYLNIGDRTIASILHSCLDTICSLLVMVGMLLIVVVLTIFLSIEIYAESIHLITVVGNVVNNTIVSNPELKQLIPEGFSELDFFDEMIGNAYLYGRKW